MHRYTLIFLLLPLFLRAQDRQRGVLFQYGVADAFLGGVYPGTYPIGELKKHGDFGLGAPDMIDGELVILDGRAYQTTSAGKTIELPDSGTTSLALVTTFRPDTIFVIKPATPRTEIYKQINKYLAKGNASYSIRVTGTFMNIKTRSFPPVKTPPYPALADMLEKQAFFTYEDVKGTLVGFKLQPFLAGVSIADFHFHFLSADHTKGGHMVDFTGSDLKVEIAEIHRFEMEIPPDKPFADFDFRKVRKGDAEKAEKGE